MFISGVGDSWGHLGVCWGLLVSSSGHLGAIAGLFKCRAHSYAGSVAVVCERVLRPYMLAAWGCCVWSQVASCLVFACPYTP